MVGSRPRRARQQDPTELGGGAVLRVPAERARPLPGQVIAGSAQRARFAAAQAAEAEDQLGAGGTEAVGEAGENLREALRLRAERRAREEELLRDVPPHWGK